MYLLIYNILPLNITLDVNFSLASIQLERLVLSRYILFLLLSMIFVYIKTNTRYISKSTSSGRAMLKIERSV